MAQIDVSDLLLDPDFIDSILIMRRTSTVNGFGENIVSETSFATVGSVQPANAKEVERLPDELRVKDVRAFYIKAEILQAATSAYPDILVFGNRRFQIYSSEPWLNWGQGWNKGLCVGEKPGL